MPTRPATHETVLLVLEIMRRIPKHRRTTAQQLHDQIANETTIENREIRTIQRQLQWIVRHYGVEVDDTSKPYGYRWGQKAPGFSIPMLSAQESLLLFLAEKHLRSLLPAGLMKAMRGFFEQARRNLEFDTDSKREREWVSKVRIIRETQPLLPPSIGQGVLEAVARALYDNAWLKIEYQNAAGKRSKYEVMPLGLAQQGPSLYLACRFEGHDNERTLALHRIRSATVSTLQFKRPKEFDLEKFDADGRFGFGEGRRIRLSFRIDKSRGQHLRETRLSEDQQIKESGDWLKVTATVVDTGRLDWWLKGFGDAVQDVRKTPVDAGKRKPPATHR